MQTAVGVAHENGIVDSFPVNLGSDRLTVLRLRPVLGVAVSCFRSLVYLRTPAEQHNEYQVADHKVLRFPITVLH